MPFGVSWLTYSKYWAASLAGVVCGSQLVHKIYKPLEGLENEIEREFQRLKEELPPPSMEERVAHYYDLQMQFEEFERNQKPFNLLKWFNGLIGDTGNE